MPTHVVLLLQQVEVVASLICKILRKQWEFTVLAVFLCLQNPAFYCLLDDLFFVVSYPPPPLFSNIFIFLLLSSVPALSFVMELIFFLNCWCSFCLYFLYRFTVAKSTSTFFYILSVTCKRNKNGCYYC